MIDPRFREIDTIVKGDDYLRNLNTGTLDITNLNPRLSFFRRIDGRSAGTANFAKVPSVVNGETICVDLAIVVRYAVSNGLDPATAYQLNISFDNPETGYSIPFGTVSLSVAQGEPHP